MENEVNILKSFEGSDVSIYSSGTGFVFAEPHEFHECRVSVDENELIVMGSKENEELMIDVEVIENIENDTYTTNQHQFIIYLIGGMILTIISHSIGMI